MEKSGKALQADGTGIEICRLQRASWKEVWGDRGRCVAGRGSTQYKDPTQELAGFLQPQHF